MRCVLGTNAQYLATEVRLEHAAMRAVVARPFEVERNAEGRASAATRARDRQRKQRRRVDAAAGHHGDTRRSRQRAIDRLLEGRTERGRSVGR